VNKYFKKTTCFKNSPIVDCSHVSVMRKNIENIESLQKRNLCVHFCNFINDFISPHSSPYSSIISFLHIHPHIHQSFHFSTFTPIFINDSFSPYSHDEKNRYIYFIKNVLFTFTNDCNFINHLTLSCPKQFKKFYRNILSIEQRRYNRLITIYK
jgi:hypothetical protein